VPVVAAAEGGGDSGIGGLADSLGRPRREAMPETRARRTGAIRD